MHRYLCIVRFGHMGAGRSFEKAMQVQARDIFEAMRRAKSLPGVKKGGMQRSGASVLKVELIPD